jgi:hypothetical protein
MSELQAADPDALHHNSSVDVRSGKNLQAKGKFSHTTLGLGGPDELHPGKNAQLRLIFKIEMINSEVSLEISRDDTRRTRLREHELVARCKHPLSAYGTYANNRSEF